MKNIFTKLKLFTLENSQRITNKLRFIAGVNKYPLKITIGASGISQQGWLISEKEYLDLTKESDWKKYFKKNSIDLLLAEHVWEHLTKKQTVLAAKNCFKYLKNGGNLRVAVPDGMFPDKKYINHVKPGSNDPDARDHKMLYTYQSFSKFFKKNGFTVKLLEYHDEKGKFHYHKWNKKNGMVARSKRFDKRNYGGKLNYTSIILDAKKIV